MTRAMETVLNLLYIGKASKQNFVNDMKWLPTLRNMAKIVITSNIHFSLPLYMNSPRRNKNMVMAPIYIGPAVNG